VAARRRSGCTNRRAEVNAENVIAIPRRDGAGMLPDYGTVKLG
jgi:hypothetical protein